MADDLKTIAESVRDSHNPMPHHQQCDCEKCILARAVLAAESEREALERIASVASAQFSMAHGRRYSPTSPFKRLREALDELERVRAAKGGPT